MPTIAFLSGKGGVGKTTSALVLALGRAQAGLPSVLIDADPNLPLTAWAERRGPPSGVEVIAAPSSGDLPAALRRARARGSFVIIDTEGGAVRLGGLATAQADLVIAPLAPSPLEVRETLRTRARTDAAARREGRVIPFAALFARAPSGYRRAFEASRITLEAAGATLLSTVLFDREAFRLLFDRGGALTDLPVREVPGVLAARRLARAFADEITDIFDL